MAYILAIVIVIAFFAALHYFTELDTRQKSVVTLVVLVIVGGAVYYNKLQDKQRAHALEMHRQFEQGKTIICEGVEVNTTNFEYSDGTQIFIGKENTPHYTRMINVLQCR